MLRQAVLPIMGHHEATTNPTLLVHLVASHVWKVNAVQLKSIRLQAAINNLFDHCGITYAVAAAATTYNF
jgi:hypothetical protein